MFMKPQSIFQFLTKTGSYNLLICYVGQNLVKVIQEVETEKRSYNRLNFNFIFLSNTT